MKGDLLIAIACLTLASSLFIIASCDLDGNGHGIFRVEGGDECVSYETKSRWVKTARGFAALTAIYNCIGLLFGLIPAYCPPVDPWLVAVAGVATFAPVVFGQCFTIFLFFEEFHKERITPIGVMYVFSVCLVSMVCIVLLGDLEERKSTDGVRDDPPPSPISTASSRQEIELVEGEVPDLEQDPTPPPDDHPDAEVLLSVPDLEQNAAVPIVPPRDEDDARTCPICLEKPKTHCCIPCGHFCLCAECSLHFPEGSRCPICKTQLEGTLRFFDS